MQFQLYFCTLKREILECQVTDASENSAEKGKRQVKVFFSQIKSVSSNRARMGEISD